MTPLRDIAGGSLRSIKSSSSPLVTLTHIVQAAAVIRTARELGVVSALQSQPVDSETLAAQLKLSPRGTRSLLAALASLRLAERTPDGRYTSTVSDIGELIDALNPMMRLDEALVADRRLAEHDTVDGAEQIYPGLVSHLAHALSEAADRAASHLGGDGLRILEVGAGAAQWSLAIVERYSDCTVTALDLPKVIPTTQAAVEAKGHQDSFEYLAADMFEVDLPPDGYDLVIMGNVCHLFGDTDNRALLRRLNGTIRAGGTLAIIDFAPDDGPETSLDLALHNLSLFVRTEKGRVHPFASYLLWLNDAGFVDVARYALENEPPMYLVTAKRQQATPYEVLSRFSERTRDAVAAEDVMPQMAQLITQGTGAQRAGIWIKTGDVFRRAASWPADDTEPAPRGGDGGELVIVGVDYVAYVEQDGELLGAVTVVMPPGEAITPTGQRLVDDVASQAGLVLRNARLTADLVETIRKLRSSRQRLIAAQDEERRRLERDLHDGAQQQIVAVKLKAAAARQLAEKGDGRGAAELLQQVVAEATDAGESLRDLAHGIYPPVLEAEGLEAALKARTAKAPIPVSVTANGVGRYPPQVEAAVYFCVLESLQNALKYAQASTVRVTLEHPDGRLVFEVSDDGKGFDPKTRPHGRGLVNMADRLDALGGVLQVLSRPGEGTTVTGSVDGVSPTADVAG